MAARSLSDFFDAFHVGPQKAVTRYNPGHQHESERQIERNLRKVMIRIACSRYALAMRQAALDWEINGASHRVNAYTRLRAAMLTANPAPLTKGQVSRVVTRVRREFELWLRRHYWRLCPADHAEIRTKHRLALRRQAFQKREKRLLYEIKAVAEDLAHLTEVHQALSPGNKRNLVHHSMDESRMHMDELLVEKNTLRSRIARLEDEEQ